MNPRDKNRTEAAGRIHSFAETHGLTTEEKKIFDMIRQGLPTPNIAAELRVSQTRVQVRVRNLMRKLGVATRREALRRADEWDRAVRLLLS